MKIFLPPKKNIKSIKKFFKEMNLEDLIKLSEIKKPEVNDMIQKNIYRQLVQ